MVQPSHLYMTTGKTIALTIWTFVGKVMSLLFNMVFRFVIAFLPRRRCLNFTAAVTARNDFGAQENEVSFHLLLSLNGHLQRAPSGHCSCSSLSPPGTRSALCAPPSGMALLSFLRWTIFKKSLLDVLQYCFCFMFWFEACGILAAGPGIKP